MARPLAFRERTEELERTSLSTWATLSCETKGRDRHEEPDPFRTVFQVDTDRILASASFRALAGKRVWLPLAGAPTRMQQTLLVVRLAGLIARAGGLNEDLTTAIAYGHALGATCFADAGEEALSAFLEEPYDRAAQAVRLVEVVEQSGEGLNLTWETRDGMLQQRPDGPAPATPEGQTVRVAARLVAVAWPVAEALGAGRLRLDDVPPAARAWLGSPGWPARLAEEVAREGLDRPEITMPEQLAEVADALDDRARWLGDRPDALADRHRAVHCVRSLVVYDAERRGDDGALVEVLQDLALATEADVLARFRAAFEPTDAAPTLRP